MERSNIWKLVVVMSVLVLACAFLTLTGCGKKAEDQDEGQQVQTEETSETVDAETGQHFDVSLESNPSTGYSWQTTKSPDGKIVQLLNSHYVDPSSGGAVGAPGQEVWQFQAIGAGSTTMVLEYARPWELDTPPAQRYTLNINVAQADNELNESFNIEVGYTLSLTLDTNPSAGYSWQLAQQPDAKVLKLVSSDTTGGGNPGAPQQQVWKFQGVAAGNTTFVLQYQGPGANAPVEKKSTVKVTVTAAPTPAPVPPKTYSDPSAPITVAPGAVFILEVKSEAGTGYQWQLLEEANTSMLKFLGSEFYASSSAAGSEGVTDFTFEALGPGQQAIKLGLVKAGDDQPSQEVQFNVTIK